MALGQIRTIDPARRTAVIALEDGRDVTVRFTTNANIEIPEPAMGGHMGGTLSDLKIGYWVEAKLDEHGNQTCSCTSLQCLS